MHYVLDCPHYAVPRIKLLEEFSGLLQYFGENLHVFKIAEKFIEILSNVIDLVSTTSISISNNNCDDQIITSPPEGVARYCFHPVCLSVCLCVCVSVCLCVCVSGQYFGILFLGY